MVLVRSLYFQIQVEIVHRPDAGSYTRGELHLRRATKASWQSRIVEGL